MALEIKPIPNPDWTLLPYEGCKGAYVKVLPKYKRFWLALLRFDSGSTIHEHPADIDVDVICLEGQGFTSVGEEQAPLRAGEYVHWPAGVPHRLWTIESEMITLMIEHQPA
jgi:quercetin dioxygenase-like cupin family protein